MKNVRSYRAMAMLCRQQAVFHPEKSWQYLGDAERWEHLAEAEILLSLTNVTTRKQWFPNSALPCDRMPLSFFIAASVPPISEGLERAEGCRGQ